MKTTLQTAAATATVVGALVLAGCHSGPSTAGSGTTTSAAAPSGAAAQSSATTSSSAPAASPAASTPASSSASARGTSAAAAGRCHTSGLAVTISAPRGPAGGQQTMSLVFTNTSPAACTMFGYAGVNLVEGSTQWSLQRQSATPKTVVLRPGGRASATLTILRWDTGDGVSYTPSRLDVTPPDETTFAAVSWPHGVVILRQDGATRPGTFIGPVS
jgi:hypothetical protein